MVADVNIEHSDVVAHPLSLDTNAVGGHNLFPNLNEVAGVNRASGN